MGRFLDSRLFREPAASAHERRIEAILLRHGQGQDQGQDAGPQPGRDRAAYLAELADALTGGEPCELPILVRVARALDDDPGLDEDARIGFWAELCRRLPGHAAALACYGDALLDTDRAADAAGVLVDAIERDPSLLAELTAELADDLGDLARAQGGELALRYEIIDLHACLDQLARQAGPDLDPAGEPAANLSESDADEQAAEVRERYSELLERCQGQGAAGQGAAGEPVMQRVRALGQRIRELEEAGVLPRVLVRRGSWRPRP